MDSNFLTVKTVHQIVPHAQRPLDVTYVIQDFSYRMEFVLHHVLQVHQHKQLTMFLNADHVTQHVLAVQQAL
jgi:hypothetical protein